MAKATPRSHCTLRGKAGAFEMSRVPCIERYSQFIAPLGTKRGPLISRQNFLCIFIINLCTALHPGVNVLPRAINLPNAKNAQNMEISVE